MIPAAFELRPADERRRGARPAGRGPGHGQGPGRRPEPHPAAQAAAGPPRAARRHRRADASSAAIRELPDGGRRDRRAGDLRARSIDSDLATSRVPLLALTIPGHRRRPGPQPGHARRRDRPRRPGLRHAGRRPRARRPARPPLARRRAGRRGGRLLRGRLRDRPGRGRAAHRDPDPGRSRPGPAWPSGASSSRHRATRSSGSRPSSGGPPGRSPRPGSGSPASSTSPTGRRRVEAALVGTSGDAAADRGGGGPRDRRGGRRIGHPCRRGRIGPRWPGSRPVGRSRRPSPPRTDPVGGCGSSGSSRAARRRRTWPGRS